MTARSKEYAGELVRKHKLNFETQPDEPANASGVIAAPYYFAKM